MPTAGDLDAEALLDDRVYPVVRAHRSGNLYVRYRRAYYIPIYGGHPRKSGQFWSHGPFRLVIKYTFAGVAKRTVLSRVWDVLLEEDA